MPVENRVRTILWAVDELMRRIDRWLRDPQSGPIVPEDVGLAIQVALVTCDAGEIPPCCRDLAVVAVPRLAEELSGYHRRDSGKVRLESGAPGPSFWASVKAVAKARSSADTPRFERPEPVAELLDQGVTHAQIARHIYGHRGVGPFLQANGAPDLGLIDQEARQPGSVIPADWVPPWHLETLSRRQHELKRKLKVFDRLELARKYDDPATVEDLLRDGAFIQQIERAKGATREEVLEAARRIGINPVDGPGYRPAARELPGFDLDDDDTAAATADRQAVKSLAIELYTQSGGTRPAVDIATELRQRGHDITANSVSATISHWKRRNARADVAVT